MCADVTQGPAVGDRYQELRDAHAGAVLAYLSHKLRDPHTAEDVAQDTWLRVHRFLPDVLARGDTAGKPWLMHLTYTTLMDHFRRVKARPQTTAMDDALAPGSAFPAALVEQETPEDAVLASGRHDAQRADASLLLELLPRAERRLVWLREWRGYTYEQMAVALNATVPGVKSRLFRAREAQRVIWERLHRRHGNRPSTQERLWTYIAGGRAWAQAHPGVCWMWLGCLSNGRPGFASVTHRPLAPGVQRTPQRCYYARRLVYALVRGALPPWANLAPCPAGARCVNPFHAAVTSKTGNPKGDRARFQAEDPASDAPAADVRVGGTGAIDNAWPGSDTIRRRREAIGISGHTLAAEAGVGHSRYWHVEQGHLVLPSTQQRVMDALARVEARLTPVTVATPATLRARRLAAGLSLEALARRSGVNADSMSSFERGRHPEMAMHSLRRIQDALDRLERERQERAS